MLNGLPWSDQTYLKIKKVSSAGNYTARGSQAARGKNRGKPATETFADMWRKIAADDASRTG
jgi:hypothetical protein